MPDSKYNRVHLTLNIAYSDKLAHVQVIYNYQYFIAKMCTCEDTLAHKLGALWWCHELWLAHNTSYHTAAGKVLIKTSKSFSYFIGYRFPPGSRPTKKWLVYGLFVQFWTGSWDISWKLDHCVCNSNGLTYHVTKDSDKLANQQVVTNCLHFHCTVVPQEEWVCAELAGLLWWRQLLNVNGKRASGYRMITVFRLKVPVV